MASVRTGWILMASRLTPVWTVLPALTVLPVWRGLAVAGVATQITRRLASVWPEGFQVMSDNPKIGKCVTGGFPGNV
jgi:hypothetical protein